MKPDTLQLDLSERLFWYSTAVVALVLSGLSVWILLLMRTHKRQELRRQQIRAAWNNILANLLMNEDLMEEGIELPPTFTAELKKPFVCSVLASELVSTRQSLRGQMADAVLSVYNQLGLVDYSAKLFYSKKWHRMAKGIQQVSAMAQYQFLDAILQRTNHHNLWVRNEAQLGMLRLRGAQGLYFLESLRQPLSEWQQFNLLHQLQLQNAQSLPDLTQWLQSENHSVAVFTIRLCQLFQCFQYAGQITALQRHPAPAIRIEANQCLHRWGLAELHTGEILPVVQSFLQPGKPALS